MLGWCQDCRAIAIDGLCPQHGITRPLSQVSAVDVHPLSTFEKRFFNERMNGLKLGDGVFLIYSDRMFRRKVVCLDVPLIEVKLIKDELVLNPLVSGEINGMDSRALLDVNRPRLERLTRVTKAFAKWELDNALNAVVAFSGGKDSIVLSDILSEFKLPRVFIDTRLEFPETYTFIRNSGENGSAVNIAKAKSSFFELCNQKGFPTHGNRWCCKTQKFAPFTDYLNEKYGTEDVFVFSGERRWEGLYRMTQPLRKAHKHIPTQQTIQPLLDWFALDIWCYIWDRGLPVNAIYNFFDRCGCWLCPFGLEYRIFLLRFTHPKLHAALMKVGGTSNGTVTRRKNGKGKKPCTMELEGRTVKTCDVYGHLFVNGACYRCGKLGESTIKVPEDSSILRRMKQPVASY